MLSAIGTSTSNGMPSPITSTAGLDVLLNRYKGKLSDQETCPSGKTTEGKANIKRLEEKISEIKNSIEALEQASRKGSAPSSTTNASHGKADAASISASYSNRFAANSSDQEAPRATAAGGLGANLDVFA